MLVANVTIDPADEEAIERFRQHVERTRDEPGTKFFCMGRWPEDPSQVVFVELYPDRAALDAHTTRDGPRPLMEGTSGIDDALGATWRIYEVDAVQGRDL